MITASGLDDLLLFFVRTEHYYGWRNRLSWDMGTAATNPAWAAEQQSRNATTPAARALYIPN